MQNKSEAQAAAQFKKMTETPVKKLITRLALPTVISMMITMIYNVTDTYFVSKISVAASGAAGIVFGLMAIIQAFGFMFGHGSGSCISRQLGAKNIENARRYSSTGFFLALLCGLIITALGLIFLEPMMKMLGSTATILPYAEAYGKYVLIAAPAMAASCVMNNILRYEGMAALAMIGLTTGGVLNIILDPVLIFALNMGVDGAGVATMVSQYISMIILLTMFMRKKTQSRINPKYFSFSPRIIADIIGTGLPSLARQGLSSISTMVLNLQAGVYGDECIAAISIVTKIGMLMFSVCIGIGQGFQPVCSFNYGAKKYSRVRSALMFTWRFSSAVMAAMGAISFIFAPRLIALFREEAKIVEIGTVALRVFCFAIVTLATVMIANMTFQAVGKIGSAFFLACTQNGLYFIPLILILPRLFGVAGIETAQPIAYVISAITALPFLISFIKNLPKEDGEPAKNEKRN